MLLISLAIDTHTMTLTKCTPCTMTMLLDWQFQHECLSCRSLLTLKCFNMAAVPIQTKKIRVQCLLTQPQPAKRTFVPHNSALAHLFTYQRVSACLCLCLFQSCHTYRWRHRSPMPTANFITAWILLIKFYCAIVQYYCRYLQCYAFVVIYSLDIHLPECSFIHANLDCPQFLYYLFIASSFLPI